MFKTSETIRLRNHDYYHNRGGKEKRSARRKANLRLYAERLFQWKYKITYLDRDAMLSDQGGRCKSCGASSPGNKKGWAIDHDHTTGKIRGVLCSGCNTALGHMKEDPVRIRALANYAEEYC